MNEYRVHSTSYNDDECGKIKSATDGVYSTPQRHPISNRITSPIRTGNLKKNIPPIDPVDPLVSAEIRIAGRRFCEAINADEKLVLLSMIDPIRAYSEAGIGLSRSARKHIRQAHPNLQHGNVQLYEDIRDGKLNIPWIKKIKVSFRGNDGDDPRG